MRGRVSQGEQTESGDEKWREKSDLRDRGGNANGGEVRQVWGGELIDGFHYLEESDVG